MSFLFLCFLLGGLGIFYPYFGYPLLLKLFSKPANDSHDSDDDTPPSFSIIVTAHNEVAGIESKIKNSQALRQEYKGESELIVASDASSDGTDDVVKANGVKLVRSEERKGKEFAQKRAQAEAKGDIVLFTDVRATLEDSALERLGKYFRDPSVGAVSTYDRVVSREDGKSSGEGFYVRYEMWLRNLESKFCSLIGLSGSGFAVRRELCADMRTDIPSDFALLLESRKRGLRGLQASDVVCSYEAVASEEKEFARKVRTVLRGISTFFASFDFKVLSKDPVFLWQLLSHKLSRWKVPFAYILLGVSLAGLSCSSVFFGLLFAGFLIFNLMALAAYLRPGLRGKTIFKVPLFFVVTNLAILIAWMKYFSGQRSVSWQPSQRS